jgi:hypothetical protein
LASLPKIVFAGSNSSTQNWAFACKAVIKERKTNMMKEVTNFEVAVFIAVLNTLYAINYGFVLGNVS